MRPEDYAPEGMEAGAARLFTPRHVTTGERGRFLLAPGQVFAGRRSGWKRYTLAGGTVIEAKSAPCNIPTCHCDAVWREVNPNTNCLEGVRCPSCGSFGPFRIEARVTVLVMDDGTEDMGADYSWDEDAPTACEECDHSGTLNDFTDNATED